MIEVERMRADTILDGALPAAPQRCHAAVLPAAVEGGLVVEGSI